MDTNKAKHARITTLDFTVRLLRYSRRYGTSRSHRMLLIEWAVHMNDLQTSLLPARSRHEKGETRWKVRRLLCQRARQVPTDLPEAIVIRKTQKSAEDFSRFPLSS